MLYEHDLTVPANTPIDSPAEYEMQLDEPVVTRCKCFFPPGCEGLAHGSVWYGEYRLWPHPEYDWAAIDADSVEGPANFESGEEEPTIILKGYNEDDTFSHTLYFYITAHPRWYLYWRKTLSRIARALRGLAGGGI